MTLAPAPGPGPAREINLLWLLLLVLPLGTRLTDFWLLDFGIILLLAVLIERLYAFGVPRSVMPPRRALRSPLWGRMEWLLLALFVASQLPFLFDPLPAGRDYQPALMAAAVNAMRLGAGSMPSPLAPVAVIVLAVAAGVWYRCRVRLRWHILAWLLAVAGVTLLAHRLPLAAAAIPAPTGIMTLWLMLGGISEPVFRTLLLALCAGAGLVWHRLGWRVTGTRTGALLALALAWGNPATMHYAHTGAMVPAVLLLTGLLALALTQLRRRSMEAPAAWLIMLLFLAWHPLLLVVGLLLPVAWLKDDEVLTRAARTRLWASAWLAALAVTAARGYAGVSGAAELLVPADFWGQGGRLLLPWLALPALLTYTLTVLAAGYVLYRLTRLPLWAGFLPLLWALLVGAQFLELLPPVAWLLTVLAVILAVPAAMAVIVSGSTLAERLALACGAGALGITAATMAAARVEWWLFALPGVLLPVACLLARVLPARLPAWLPALAVAVPLAAVGLFSGGSEWVNLATRQYYAQDWPAAAQAVAGLPDGSGVYCPLADSPLPFYLARARAFDRLRLLVGPWLSVDYQRLESLFEWCVARRCRFAIVPRGYYLDDGLPQARRTGLTRLQEDFPARLADFAWPGAWVQNQVRPLAGEDLLAGRDLRFALRAVYGRTGNQLLLVEAGTLEMAVPSSTGVSPGP